MKEENKLALIVAYYLSKYDEAAYKNLALGNKTKTHNAIGQKLGVKPNTVKNMRDEFDRIHDNPRRGWDKRELTATRKEVVKKFRKYSEKDLLEAVSGILTPSHHSKGNYSTKEYRELSSSDREALEGELVERKIMMYKRNAANTKACKDRDQYTCQACNFKYDNKIVECHHLKPLSMGAESVVKTDDLLTLCPTCHRLAHNLLKQCGDSYTNRGILVSALKKIARDAYK